MKLKEAYNKKNEAAEKTAIIILNDFEKTHDIYVGPYTGDIKADFKAGTIVSGNDFIVGFGKDPSDRGAYPYPKFEKKIKGLYDAVLKARENDADSINTYKYDISELMLGFGGIDPTSIDDSDLEDFESFLAYAWQDLRDANDLLVAHIRNGVVADGNAFINRHVSDLNIKPLSELPEA